MKTALWWIRRDLRLEHNLALAAALASAERVIPVFVLDPALLGSPYFSEKRFGFLLGGLRELDASLRERGSRLVVRRGPPLAELSRLVRETQAEAIYREQDVSPYARNGDRSIQNKPPLKGVWGLSYLSPSQALKPDGSPYTQFTAFSRAWRREAAGRSTSIRRAPSRLPDSPKRERRASGPRGACCDGATMKTPSPPGVRVRPATRSSTPECASSRGRGSCTTGPA